MIIYSWQDDNQLQILDNSGKKSTNLSNLCRNALNTQSSLLQCDTNGDHNDSLV